MIPSKMECCALWQYSHDPRTSTATSTFREVAQDCCLKTRKPSQTADRLQQQAKAVPQRRSRSDADAELPPIHLHHSQRSDIKQNYSVSQRMHACQPMMQWTSSPINYYSSRYVVKHHIISDCFAAAIDPKPPRIEADFYLSLQSICGQTRYAIVLPPPLFPGPTRIKADL